MKIPLFNEILKLPSKEVKIKSLDSNGNQYTKTMTLRNKTVDNPFFPYFNVCRNWGLKNFMNSHCAVYYEPENMNPIIIVLLGCYGAQDREKDIQQIIEWYIKRNFEDDTKPKPIVQGHKNTKTARNSNEEMPSIPEQMENS